jgi:hypothetical protein
MIESQILSPSGLVRLSSAEWCAHSGWAPPPKWIYRQSARAGAEHPEHGQHGGHVISIAATNIEAVSDRVEFCL